VKRRLPALWLVLALPGLLQVFLLAVACFARLAHPYDLEWMEGGMLTHAARIADGKPLYGPPSVDFIPYLYTPLYPWLLAVIGKLAPLGYALGRAVSVASTAAILLIAAHAVVREAPHADRWPARTAALLGWGLFAAAYPWVEGFYDLVRGDMLALALGLGGLSALRARHVALGAALLAISFFAKQTGVLLVAAGGVALAVMHWRRLPRYVAVAGAIGLGGTALLHRATDGWFWVYTYQVHQNHDTNSDRFWRSFKLIFGHFPALTAVVAAGLLATAIFALARRRLPSGGGGFLYWTWLFACGTVIGAVGWSTQWAVFNAFIPALALGAIAAATAVLPIGHAASELAAALAGPLGRIHRGRLRALAAGAVVLVLGAQLLAARWDPRWSALVGDGDPRVRPPPPWKVAASLRSFVPTPGDRAAGDALIAQLAAVEGPVFFPSHPWYPRLAGKPTTFVHRIGVKDVTYELPCKNQNRSVVLGRGAEAIMLVYPCVRAAPPLRAQARRVAGLDTAMAESIFGAIVLDHGESPADYPGMIGHYHQAGTVPGPRVFTGKPTTPGVLFVPVAPPSAPSLAPTTLAPAPAKQ
jgi:hypothetical protein